MRNVWTPDRYARHAGFVPELAADLLTWLTPGPGERILDLGCGDGVLTDRIRAAGASVLGVDASAAMLDAAAARGLEVRQAAAERLAFHEEFDAVFSNAMLHWTTDIHAVATGVARALTPGGRFVGEFGGRGNVAAIVDAAAAELQARHVPPGPPWYFPGCEEFADVLAAHGFEVDRLMRFRRPTPLPTGIVGWLEVFGGPLLAEVPPADRAEVSAAIEARLAPVLRTADGRWTADYVRLRFAAVRI
jgi:trans-aconitate methyltransferase